MEKDVLPTGSAEETPSIYHEKQMKELCALHALNNLFQEKKAYSKKDLDDICLRLSPDSFINPHRSILGLGNYDVNVIMAALQKKTCEAVWFDKRKSIDCLVLEKVEGFILNIPTEYKIGFLHLPIKRKHWICIKQIIDSYYNLDSKLDSPELIGSDEDLLNYLKLQLECKEKELLLVVSPEVERDGTWRRETSQSQNAEDQTGSEGTSGNCKDKNQEEADDGSKCINGEHTTGKFKNGLDLK